MGTSIALETDLVVRTGTTTLRLASTGITVVIGSHQIRVEPGARLELDWLTLADSMRSSALVVRGSAAALRATFVRCTATTNMILSGVMDTLVTDGVCAFLAAVGGAVHIAPSASMELVDSAQLECSTGGAKFGAGGGAVFVDSKAQLLVLRSELRRNRVEGGAYCVGGALWLYTGANATVHVSVLDANVARGGSKLAAGGAAMVFLNARMALHKTEVCHNLASGDGDFVQGGGFFVYSSGQLAVSESLFCHNRLESSGMGTSVGGGAIAGFMGSLVTATQTELLFNTVRGGMNAVGGACAMTKLSEAHFLRAVFIGNLVDGGLVSNDGGALYLDSTMRLRMSDSELRNNSATGRSPRGGAIWSAAQSADLVNISLLRNRVVVSRGQGYRGAIHVNSGFLRLDPCRVHAKVAESLRDSVGGGGGGVHIYAGAVRIERSSLRSNIMGGRDVAQADASDKIGGAQMLAEGGHVSSTAGALQRTVGAARTPKKRGWRTLPRGGWLQCRASPCATARFSARRPATVC